MRVDEWTATQAEGRTVTRVSDPKVRSKTRRVTILRGVQHHRGFEGFVYVTFEGAKTPESFTCCFHQKARAAREHAAVLARSFERLVPKES